ncbi:MAG: sigma-70 family RNA polymerase sigma factor [Ferruginibacter sp.]|nr:sigma-70 family RNA polymerase sigma factor [Cytophagales bacterium]
MIEKTLQNEFVQLLAAHQKLVHTICSLYYLLPEDRQDLFQEIALQLWKSYPTFNHQSKITTWIYRVAINTVFAKIRKEKSRPKSDSFSEAAFQVPQPETPFEQVEAIADLYRAIHQLSDVDKAIVMLYLDEHSYEEIANIVKMSRTNVSTRIGRIKARLEKRLKPQTQ